MGRESDFMVLTVDKDGKYSLDGQKLRGVMDCRLESTDTQLRNREGVVTLTLCVKLDIGSSS